MAINVYQDGDLVRVEATFTNADDQEIDPDAVTINVTRPDGTTTTTSWPDSPTVLVRESLGNFYIDVDTTGYPGDWHYAWVSTGTGQASQVGEFSVEPLSY